MTIPNPFIFHSVVLDVAAYIGLILLIALLVVLTTLLLARLARHRFRGALERAGMQVNAAILLSRTAAVAVWATGLVLVLYILGIGLAPLAAFVGVVGLAASLSLQSLLQNLVAGVYLLAERPFRINDIVAIVGPNGANHRGKVEDVQMRTTLLRNDNDELVMVPNSIMFTGVVTNITAVGGYIMHVNGTFPRVISPQNVALRVRPLLESVGMTERAPDVRVQKVESETWSAEISFWVARREDVSGALWSLGTEFPEATFDSGVVT